MKIEVLGAVAGCANCKKLLARTISATSELAIEAKVEYIAGTERLLQLGIMQSPALVINQKVVCSGFIPSVEKIKSLLNGAKVNGNADGVPSSNTCKCDGDCA